MTKAELKKVLVVEKLNDRHVTVAEAAALLGLSTRRSCVSKKFFWRKVHQPRSRKPQAGMLRQIDASPFAWREDRSPPLTLHGDIDDATGMVAGAVFRSPKEALTLEQELAGETKPLSHFGKAMTGNG